jgi:hypothetical protein
MDTERSILLTKSAINQLDLAGKIKRNFKQPPIKDNFMIPTGGYTIIRLLVDKPGFWAFYSNVQIFFQTGTMAILQVGNQDIFPQKPNNWPSCGSDLGPTLF